MKTQPEISNEDIIKSCIGMICPGDVHFEDMEKFSNDMVFKNGLCVKNVPSSSTLRIRLNGFEEEIENILRMDSGFDSADNLAVCEEFGVMYLVKRNPRKETAEKWLEIAEENYSKYYDIQYGKKVYLDIIKIASKFVKGGRKLYKIKICKHELGFHLIFEKLYAAYAVI